MSTEQKFNAYRSRYMQTTPQTLSAKASDYASGKRRPSVPDNLLSRPHTYRPSRLNYSSTRVPEDSPQMDQGSFGQERADGDSVVSTVQSAVWDEMQEMKSHVQRVEPNWRFPSGGGASSGSVERPRTATTTITTISSSPKLPMKSIGMSPTSSSSRGVAEAANIHPLLHQSLARCKPLVGPALHRALESAASDALDMAVWSRTTGPQGSIYSSASAINGVTGDRQLRRKADNLCRNLTELCIALIEVKQETPDRASTSFNQRRESRDVSSAMSMTPSETLPKPYSRHASLEPEEVRATPSRALDRVEARRASYNLNTPPASSPRDSTHSSATQRQTQPVSANTSPQVASLLRSGTSLLRSRRLPTEVDDDQPTLRAPSRAVTEIGTVRKRSDRLSSGFGLSRIQDQGHATQHLLPLPHSSAIRRVTGGSSDQPTTPGLVRGAARRYLDREKTLNTLSVDSATDEEKKMKRRSWGLYAGSSGASSTGGRSLTLGRGNNLNKGARTSLIAGGGD
jgi:hypothetical protein